MNLYDFIVDALEFNESLDFVKLIICIGLYLFFFWFSVSVWVFIDAKKRYKPNVAFLIALGVFFLFFPALILYIAARHPLAEDVDPFFNEGVNIPVINFVGDDGVKITFELNVSRHGQTVDGEKDMKINVDWTSKQSNFNVQEKQIENGKHEDEIEKEDEVKGEKKTAISTKIKSFFSGISTKILDIKNAVKNKISKTEMKKEKEAKGDEDKENEVKKEEVTSNEKETEVTSSEEKEENKDNSN